MVLFLYYYQFFVGYRHYYKISKNYRTIQLKTSIYTGCPKSKSPIFSIRRLTVRMLWKLGEYSVWDSDNTEFLVSCSARTKEKSGTTNKKLPIACVSTCILCAVMQFLIAKNMSAVEIHRQLTEVYGSEIMSVQMAKMWCREFCEGRCKMHDESHTGHPKVVMDESVNTIRTLLNEDYRLTL